MTTARSTRLSSNDLFLDCLPPVLRLAKSRFRGLPPVDRDEAVAEAQAAAFQAFNRLHQQGRTDVVFSPGFAAHAVHHVLNDRHVGGSMSSRNVLSRQARQRHGFDLQSLYVPTTEGDWHELAVEDKHAGPAEVAAFRLDFGAWSSNLDDRARRVVDLLAAGYRPGEAARRLGVSPARVSQLRSELRKSWLEFQGEGQGEAPSEVQTGEAA
jgi:hypothetical protein